MSFCERESWGEQQQTQYTEFLAAGEEPPPRHVRKLPRS
jgi:hypothetical protein